MQPEQALVETEVPMRATAAHAIHRASFVICICKFPRILFGSFDACPLCASAVVPPRRARVLHGQEHGVGRDGGAGEEARA